MGRGAWELRKPVLHKVAVRSLQAPNRAEWWSLLSAVTFDHASWYKDKDDREICCWINGICYKRRVGADDPLYSEIVRSRWLCFESLLAVHLVHTTKTSLCQTQPSPMSRRSPQSPTLQPNRNLPPSKLISKAYPTSSIDR